MKQNVQNATHDRREDDLIVLGDIVIETKGVGMGSEITGPGKLPPGGISEE